MTESIQWDHVLVRPALFSDAERICRIYNHHIDVGGATFDKVHWPTERVSSLLEVGLPDGWYVTEIDGHVCGWASARRFSDRQGYRQACETAIYLEPQATGRGVANLLQQRIEDHCRENGFHHAVAKIIANNARSMAFHDRWGYELVGIQKEIGRVDDQWVDVAILQRVFRTVGPESGG